jgi:hypothetical protein
LNAINWSCANPGHALDQDYGRSFASTVPQDLIAECLFLLSCSISFAFAVSNVTIADHADAIAVVL